jgi:tetratricopeptide (TPR) repeat protein
VKMRKMMALGLAVGRNDIPRIEALCTEALRVDESDGMALMVLADTYWRNRQPEKALSPALKALEIEPSDFYALRIVAGIYAARGKHALAHIFAKRLVTADPPMPPPTKTVSRILRPFTWLAKARRLKERVELDEVESKTSYTDWVQWAKEYVTWYENSPHSAP